MKLFLLFVAVVLALVAAAPQNSDVGAPGASGTFPPPPSQGAGGSPLDMMRKCKRKSWFFV